MRELPIARPKFRFSLLYGWARRAMRTVPCPIVSEWSLPGDYERIEPGFPQRRFWTLRPKSPASRLDSAILSGLLSSRPELGRKINAER